MSEGNNFNDHNLRIIRTARDIEAINNAARDGLFPLIKKVVPSPEIRSKYSVLQSNKTGEIVVVNDFRSALDLAISPESFDLETIEFETIIDFTFYYPYSFPSPFAAYLVPKDIEVGEKVFIEDLIEDYVGTSWNQGDAVRLEGCEAIWNGKDFDIQYDPNNRQEYWIG
jgi:hypothetical protein